MEKKSFGARLLALVTSVVTSLLLIVLGVLRAPLVIFDELTDEHGPLRMPTKRKVTKQDFASPEEFLSFLKVRLREVWKDRLGGFLVVILGSVLRIFKEPVDTLHDFYENIDDPNYDPTDMQSVSATFWNRVKSVWRRKTLVGRKVYAFRLQRKAKQTQKIQEELGQEEKVEDEMVQKQQLLESTMRVLGVRDSSTQTQKEEQSFHPENLSHP